MREFFANLFKDGNRRFITIVFIATCFTLFGAGLQYIEKTRNVLAEQARVEKIRQTDYIKFIGPISFDRKLYGKCDTIKAQLTLEIKTDSQIITRYRLHHILQPPADQLTDDLSTVSQTHVVASKESTGFVIIQNEPQTYIVDYKIPCELEEGAYYFRGDLTYWKDGVEKSTPFQSVLFRIDMDTPALYPHN